MTTMAHQITAHNSPTTIQPSAIQHFHSSIQHLPS
nr:MAG TPA: hypothetical protein [Caudoviricetes sp.]